MGHPDIVHHVHHIRNIVMVVESVIQNWQQREKWMKLKKFSKRKLLIILRYHPLSYTRRAARQDCATEKSKMKIRFNCAFESIVKV